MPDPQSRDDVTSVVAGLFRELGASVPETIGRDDDLVADFGLDSLSLLELLERVERTYDVTLDEDALARCRTVGEWIDAVDGAMPDGATGSPDPSPARSEPVRPGVLGPREPRTPAKRPRPRLGAADIAYAAYGWVVVFFFALVSFVVVVLPVPLERRWQEVRAAIRAIAAALRIPVTVEGSFPRDKEASVLVANHRSFLDGFVVILASHEPVVFVTSNEIGRTPLVGRFLRRIGCVFVGRGEAADPQVALETLAAPLAENKTLFVFPEGGIVSSGTLGPFRLGAFSVAARAMVPVVPIGIVGTAEVLPPGTRLARRAAVVVRIGEPIRPSGPEFSDQVELRDATFAALSDLVQDPPPR